MKSTASGLTTAALTMAAALSLSVNGPHRAYAAPAPSSVQFESSLAITVLSPTPHTSFSGAKPVEVSAFYQGADNNQIVAIELFVDGSGVYTKRLEAPEARGVISFLIDASQLTAGNHSIVVRATASDQQVVSAKSSFLFVAEKSSNQTEIAQPVTTTNSNSVLPELTYISPSADQSVSGNVKILLKASDPSGRSPYVSLFIDRTFKTLRNYPPYEYEWDTTSYPNGYHTIEAYAYNEDQNVGPAKILRVLVNNPGGRTQIRKDLKDASTPALKPVKKLAPAALADSQVKHDQTKANPSIITGKNVGTSVNRVTPDLSDPYIPNIPVSSGKTTKIAKLPAVERTEIAPASGLSDPFVKDAATAPKSEKQSNKAIGPARRPTPRMALSAHTSRSAHIRATMMAKRQELLDQTGGLTLQSELSDPFIPETATLKTDRREAKTPMTGFKPLPKQQASQQPALATVTPGDKPQINQPSIISRDAHTMPVKLPTPSMVQPMVKAAAPMIQAISTPALPVAKHVAIKTEILPVAKTVAINNKISAEAKLATPVLSEKAQQVKAVSTYVLPVSKTVKINTSHITTHKVAIHTGGSVNLAHAKGQMKVLFNHTMLRLDRPITEKAGVMFSPLRQIFEFQGGSLTWQSKTGTVHAQSDTKNIDLTIGNRKAKINNEVTILDGAPFLSQGRTMVPLSLLPLALDVDVQYDEASGHLLVVTKH